VTLAGLDMGWIVGAGTVCGRARMRRAARRHAPSAMRRRSPPAHHGPARFAPLSTRLLTVVVAVLLVPVLLLLAACAPLPATVDDRALAPSLPERPGHHLQDLRAPYRQAVCRRLAAGGAAAADGQGCAQWLRRLDGEPAAAPPPWLPGALAGPPDRAALAARYRIAFVPGLLAECFDKLARPFGDAEQALLADGFSVDHVSVPGRGSSAAGAQRLADHFASLPADPRPVILFAYSKGLPDVLEFLVQHPQQARPVAAVVSVAGAVHGSLLADRLMGPYRQWLAGLPLPGCAPGDGEELHSLQPAVRRAWWQAHGAAIGTPVFSLVAEPRPEQVSPATRSTWSWLSEVDPRNDGKLLSADQIVPGSHLLGFVNADHWSIAIPLLAQWPVLAPLVHDGVPRPALVGAAVEVVAQELALRAAARP